MAQISVKMLGCRIDALTMEQTLQAVEQIILLKHPVQHVVVNAAKLVALERDQRLKHIVNSCQLINADGQSVVWASKLLGRPLPERVAGIDLMHELIQLAARKGYKVYFLGAREDVINSAVITIRHKYPQLKIVGFRNGYFGERENAAVIESIRDARPDILFVGMSSPKKEYWLADNLDKLEVPFCMGVGGSFDVVAGVTRRAPLWLQRCGLEWLYRLAQEPRRMWKRYLIGNTKFILLVLQERWGLYRDRERGITS